MRNNLQLFVLIAALLTLLGGCALTGGTNGESSETSVQEASDTTSDPVPSSEPVEKVTASVEDYQLRDNDAVYEDDDEDSIVTMYLTVRKGNSAENTDHTWTEVNTYSKYWYEENNINQYAVEGILQIGDENGPIPGELGYGETVPNTIVKIRGQTSTMRNQKNYKIEIKDGKGEWRGQQTINLNKHVSEGTRFINKLAYDLMKDIPEMMSARTQFVHLYVKDETEGINNVFEDYGLYTQVEQINKRYLKTHGLDSNGQLYKAEFFEFFRYEDAIKLSTDPTYDLDVFEDYLEVKGDSDHTKLIEMLEDVNDYSIPIEDTVEKWFDTENLFYWMGFHILMGNVDTQSRNYYLYSPLNVNKFYFISWDNDGSFNSLQDELRGQVSSEGSWMYGISNYWGNVLYQRLFKNEDYRNQLTQTMDILRTQYLTEDKINSLINMYRYVVKPYVYSMPDIIYAPFTEEEYESMANGIAGEIEKNYNTYLLSLEKPMPFYIGTPELIDGNLQFIWDAAYDFDNEDITYSVEIASDYLFQNVLYSQLNQRIPQIEISPLPAGQYFVRIRATNESGQTQDAFDYYNIDGRRIWGTRCFYVLPDGSIGVDTYAEDE